jgi:hypothetical protein
MTLRLRLTWPDEDRPNDFQVWAGDQAVGRMYATSTPMGDQWLWSVYGLSIRGGVLEGGIVPHG